MKRTQPYHISMYRIMESRGFFVHQQQQQKKRLSSVDSRSIHLKSSYVLSKLFNNLASVISLPPSLTCSLWTVVNTLMRLQWHNGFIINKKQSPIDWHLMILHISFSSAFHPYFVLFLLVLSDAQRRDEFHIIRISETIELFLKSLRVNKFGWWVTWT